MNPSLAPNLNFVQPTFRRAAIVWWALLWRAILFGGGAGFVVGFIEGLFGVQFGVSDVTIRYLTFVSGAIVGVPVGIWVVQLALKKRYREFTICLVPTQPGESG